MSEAVVRPLARFTFTVDAEDVLAFAAALDLPASSAPPPTFAIRLLFHPAARAALAAFMPTDGSLPIHIGQRFRYHRPLRAGEALSCAVGAAPAGDGRPFALVHLAVTTPDGDAVCETESDIVIARPGFVWTERGEAR